MTPRVSPNFKRLLRDLAILVAITVAMIIAGAAARAEETLRSRKTDEVRLASVAEVARRSVTLGDVATLEGERVQKLAGLLVLELTDGQTEGAVTVEDLREKLGAEGLSQMSVAMRGYARCKVVLREGGEAPITKPVDRGETIEAPKANLANPTLRDLLYDKLVVLTGAPLSDLRVHFSQSDAGELARSTRFDRFEVVTDSVTGLGRVPFTVTRWSGNRAVETLRIGVEVSRRVKAVVVTQSVGRGEALSASQFELKDVWLDRKAEPIGDLRVVIGQTAASSLRPGAVVYPSHLRSATVVQRNELMSVRCLSGGLVIKLTARAGDDAAINDVITVRKENSRETLAVRVTGPREGVMVVGEELAAAQGDKR